MKEPFELIYSRQTSGFTKGKAFANPRFFTTPRKGVTKVTIIGEWPKVEKAYRDLGVPVEVYSENHFGTLEPLVRREEPVEPKPPESSKYADIEIPENWRDLPWVGGEDTLRALALKLTDQQVVNKSQAVAVIAAELARREP